MFFPSVWIMLVEMSSESYIHTLADKLQATFQMSARACPSELGCIVADKTSMINYMCKYCVFAQNVILSRHQNYATTAIPMSTDKRTRTATVSGTGRTSFAFDAATWAAIDNVASAAGQSWSEWARRAIEQRPATSKAASIRAALADALLAKQAQLLMENMEPGTQVAERYHPVIGNGYHRLDDATLATELDGAVIELKDDSFEGFTLIVGHRAKSVGGEPFIAIENRLRGGLHLFIAPEVEQ